MARQNKYQLWEEERTERKSPDESMCIPPVSDQQVPELPVGGRADAVMWGWNSSTTVPSAARPPGAWDPANSEGKHRTRTCPLVHTLTPLRASSLQTQNHLLTLSCADLLFGTSLSIQRFVFGIITAGRVCVRVFYRLIKSGVTCVSGVYC